MHCSASSDIQTYLSKKVQGLLVKLKVEEKEQSDCPYDCPYKCNCPSDCSSDCPFDYLSDYSSSYCSYAPLIALMITLMIAPLIVPLPHSKGSFSFAQAPFNLLAHLIEKVQPAIERILHIYSTLIFFSSFINEILYNCHLLKHFCIFCSNLKNFTSHIFS